MTKEENMRRLGKQCRVAIDMLRLYCPLKEEFIDEITKGLREASKIIEEHYEEETDDI